MGDASKSIQDTFKPYHEEIKRRTQVCSETATGSKFFQSVSSTGADHQFRDPAQQHVLFSVSHTEMSPRSLVPSQPALRIYGLFESAEAARAHAQTVMQCDPACNVQVDLAHKWILACRNIQRLSDGQLVSHKTQKLLDAYEATRIVSDKEFEANRKEQRAGGATLAAEDAEEPHACQDAKAANPHISRLAEVRAQSVVVLSCVKDTSEGEPPEFLFRAYRACESEQEADQFVRNVASREVQDFDIDVINACEWVYPQQADGSTIRTEVYRDDELQRIMSTHKTSGDRVQQFRKEQEESEATAPAVGGGDQEAQGGELV